MSKKINKLKKSFMVSQYGHNSYSIKCYSDIYNDCIEINSESKKIINENFLPIVLVNNKSRCYAATYLNKKLNNPNTFKICAKNGYLELFIKNEIQDIYLESFFIVEEGKNQGLHKETIETLIYFIDIINSNTLRAMKKYLENEYSKREYGGIPLDIFDMLIQYKKDKNLDSIKLVLECY